MSLLGTARHWLFYYPLGLLILTAVAALVFLFNPFLFPFAVLYILYVLLWGNPTFAELQMWATVRQATQWPTPDLTTAFPVVGTDRLPPPTQPALYTFHPHGLLNITRAVHTIDPHSPLFVHLRNAYHAIHSGFFHVPFLREIMLYGGCIPATHAYMDWAITQGKSVTLTPGGAREVQYAREGTNREVWLLRNRKGFLRFARRHGLPIVPLYTAGEQDAFTSAEGGWVGRPLQWLSGVLRSVTGLTVDLNILQAFRPANLWKWSALQNTDVPVTVTSVCELLPSLKGGANIASRVQGLERLCEPVVTASAEATADRSADLQSGQTERQIEELDRQTERGQPSVDTLQSTLLQRLQNARQQAPKRLRTRRLSVH